MGTIIMMYLHGGDWRMIRETLQVLGAPTSAHELKIPEDVVVQALTQAHTIRPERYTILGNGLTEAAARAAAETTKVI
jgi:glycerol-1-phosphate dehydrogenase [NAD(P)+]